MAEPISEQLAKVKTEAQKIIEAAESEGRDFTEDETKSLEQARDTVDELMAAYERSERTATLKAKLAAANVDGDEDVEAEVIEPAKPGRKSPGEIVTGSDAWAAFRKMYPSGPPLNSRVNLPPVSVPGGLDGFRKATISGTVGNVDFYGGSQPQYAPPSLLDLVTRGSTAAEAVNYFQLNAGTSVAAAVAQAAAKPESTLTPVPATAPAVTVATWIPATKQILADAGTLRAMIDGWLRNEVLRTVERDMINGDGVTEFEGILTVTGTQAQAYSTSPIETVRKAITKIEGIGGVATAVAMNPADAEAVDLVKDTTGRYLGNGPFSTGPSTLWGLTRVSSLGVPVGQAVVADWTAAFLLDRENVSVAVSDSHSDYFVKNQVAILAEGRWAFGVLVPPRFVICDLTA